MRRNRQQGFFAAAAAAASRCVRDVVRGDLQHDLKRDLPVTPRPIDATRRGALQVKRVRAAAVTTVKLQRLRAVTPAALQAPRARPSEITGTPAAVLLDRHVRDLLPAVRAAEAVERQLASEREAMAMIAAADSRQQASRSLSIKSADERDARAPKPAPHRIALPTQAARAYRDATIEPRIQSERPRSASPTAPASLSPSSHHQASLRQIAAEWTEVSARERIADLARRASHTMDKLADDVEQRVGRPASSSETACDLSTVQECCALIEAMKSGTDRWDIEVGRRAVSLVTCVAGMILITDDVTKVTPRMQIAVALTKIIHAARRATDDSRLHDTTRRAMAALEKVALLPLPDSRSRCVLDLLHAPVIGMITRAVQAAMVAEASLQRERETTVGRELRRLELLEVDMKKPPLTSDDFLGALCRRCVALSGVDPTMRSHQSGAMLPVPYLLVVLHAMAASQCTWPGTRTAFRITTTHLMSVDDETGRLRFESLKPTDFHRFCNSVAAMGIELNTEGIAALSKHARSNSFESDEQRRKDATLSAIERIRAGKVHRDWRKKMRERRDAGAVKEGDSKPLPPRALLAKAELSQLDEVDYVQVQIDRADPFTPWKLDFDDDTMRCHALSEISLQWFADAGVAVCPTSRSVKGRWKLMCRLVAVNGNEVATAEAARRALFGTVRGTLDVVRLAQKS